MGTREQILKLHKKKMKQKDIAEKVGVNTSRVWSIINNYKYDPGFVVGKRFTKNGKFLVG